MVGLPQPKQAVQETLRQLPRRKATMVVTEGVCSPLEAPITAQAVVAALLLLAQTAPAQLVVTAALVLREPAVPTGIPEV